MAHKTLVGGTAYNITGGKSMVSGTTYSISGGKTMVDGTAYNINFVVIPQAYAMLYSDKNLVFQRGNEVESGKTLVNSYRGFESSSYYGNYAVTWNINKRKINNVK